MGCNRDRKSEKSERQNRPSSRKLSHKQEMERPYREGRQHQPQKLILCITKRNKLRTVQVYGPTKSYSEETYNDVDDTKPLHDLTPICLLSNIYKVLRKVPTKRME